MGKRTAGGNFVKKPIATYVLIGLNFAVFVVMTVMSSGKNVLQATPHLLLQWGGNSGYETLVAQEPWRLLTAAFVHGSVFHLLVNMFALWDLGKEVERAFGVVRFLIIYFCAAVGGAVIGAMIHPLLVGVGASGAICGLFGALMAIAWRRPQNFPKGYLMMHGKFLVCIILYMFVMRIFDPRIDHAGHAGGLAVGFVAGLMVLPDVQRTRLAVQTCGLVLLLALSYAVAFKLIADNPEVAAKGIHHQAISKLHDKDSAGALILLDQALAVNPKDTAALCDRARAHVDLKHFDQALADCNSAISLNPASEVAFMVRANVYSKRNAHALAIADLTKVIALDPTNYVAYNNRAWSDLALGQYPPALEDCASALKLNSSSATTYDTRAVAYILTGNLSAAIADLNRSISLQPKDSAYYYHRALAKQRSSDPTYKADLTRAQELKYEPESWEPKVSDTPTHP